MNRPKACSKHIASRTLCIYGMEELCVEQSLLVQPRCRQKHETLDLWEERCCSLTRALLAPGRNHSSKQLRLGY